MGEVVRTVRDRHTLERHLVKGLFTVTPAERIAVLFTPEMPADRLTLPTWDRYGRRPTEMYVNRAILQEVFAEGVPVLRNEIYADEVLGSPAAPDKYVS